MTHFEIVQYLVEHAGADISIPNFNGECLLTLPLILNNTKINVDK